MESDESAEPPEFERAALKVTGLRSAHFESGNPVKVDLSAAPGKVRATGLGATGVWPSASGLDWRPG